MPFPPRLIKRGNVYCFRCSIPRDIKGSYPKTEETFSLGTSDYQEALKKLRKASADVDQRFDDHRQWLAKQREPLLAELTDGQIKHIEDVYFAHLLTEDEDMRMAGLDDAEFEAYGELLDNMDSANRYALSRGTMHAFAEAETAEVLTWDNIDLLLDPASPSWPKVSRALISAMVRATEAKRKRNEGLPVSTPAMPEAKLKSTEPLASEIMKGWIDEKSRANGGWTPTTAKANQLWAERFIAMVGDRALSTYTKADARMFKSSLLSLPPNWTKNKALARLTMLEAANRAKALGLKTMSGKNANKIIGFVHAYWNWAMQNYDNIPNNPFDGLKVTISGKARDERQPFTPEELKKIFKSPIYTGCKSLRYHNTPGNLIPTDNGIFWVPLIGLYTGCRSGEIIQLATDDVKVDGDIAYFEVTDEGDDQDVKNGGSRRRIPVHQALKDMGLMRFVERQRRRKSKRLFPEMPKAADGMYSTSYASKFGNTLTSLGVKHDRNSFHSFRHCFEDACRNSRIPLDFVNALQGHSQRGMAGRYGHGRYGLELLSEEMAKLKIEGVDLSHLTASKG